MGSLPFPAESRGAMAYKSILTISVLTICFNPLMILAALTNSQRIYALEKQVEELEASVDSLESLFVARYGLIRQCERPVVLNGKAKCPTKLKPGSSCTVVCDPGYIATPGKGSSSCITGGVWSAELNCEIPLLLISGGTVDTSNNGYSGVEAISVYTSTGCDVTLPDMPLADGSHRSLHNLIYVYPNKLLACNGLTAQKEATCDFLTLSDKQSQWKHHSYPNEYRTISRHVNCDKKWERELYVDTCKKNDEPKKERKKGVYAAQYVEIGDKTVIAGGMIYDDNGNTVEKSVEFKTVGASYFGDLKIHARSMADLNTPRSGHSCTVLNQEKQSVIVSGGTKGFGHGEAALKGAEILNATANIWMEAAAMNTGRFGHALVMVGDKVIAVGGDTKVPSNILDTIEEYDISSNTWRILEKRLKKPRTNFGYTLVPHSIFDGCVIHK